MIIKIGNAEFETNGDYPIMLILNDEEKTMISEMDKADRICFAPADWPEEKISKWMGGEELEKTEKIDEK